jgi:hypothetical protein
MCLSEIAWLKLKLNRLDEAKPLYEKVGSKKPSVTGSNSV